MTGADTLHTVMAVAVALAAPLASHWVMTHPSATLDRPLFAPGERRPGNDGAGWAWALIALWWLS